MTPPRKLPHEKPERAASPSEDGPFEEPAILGKPNQLDETGKPRKPIPKRDRQFLNNDLIGTLSPIVSRKIFSSFEDYVPDKDRIAELLRQGADPNSTDKDGWTALHMATSLGYTDAAEQLLAAGADPNRTHPANGDTSLHLAVFSGRHEIIRALMAAGADPDRINHNGRSPSETALLGIDRITAEVLRKGRDDRSRTESETRIERAALERQDALLAKFARNALREALGADPSDEQLRRLAATEALHDENEFSAAVRAVLDERPTLAQRRDARADAPATPEEIFAAERSVFDWLAIGNAPPKPAAFPSAVRRASCALETALAAEPTPPRSSSGPAASA